MSSEADDGGDDAVAARHMSTLSAAARTGPASLATSEVPCEVVDGSTSACVALPDHSESWHGLQAASSSSVSTAERTADASRSSFPPALDGSSPRRQEHGLEGVSVLVRLRRPLSLCDCLAFAVEDGTLATPRSGRLTSQATCHSSAPSAAVPDSGSDACRRTPSGHSLASSLTAGPASHSRRQPSSPCHRRCTSSCDIGTTGKVLTIASPVTADERKYEFGDVLGPDTANAVVCRRVVPAVMRQLQRGYHVCVLCYGQTGSGKTYTANALTADVAAEVFRTVDTENDVVELSCVQLYNNKAYNMMAGPHGGRYGAELSKPLTGAWSSGAGGAAMRVPEPRYMVRDVADVRRRVRAAQRVRAVGSHALNAQSSRSFCLLSLYVTRFLDGAPLVTTRVTVADLAGTERLKKTGASGEAQEQAIFINKSLLALRELLESSGADDSVLHFRDSLLTTYLAPCIRSWHVILIVTASLDVAHYDETRSSMEFATNARRRKVRKVLAGVMERLTGCVGRAGEEKGGGAGAPSGCGGGSGARELQSVIDVLLRRIQTLEDAVRVKPEHDAAAEDGVQLRDLLAQCEMYRLLLRDREEELVRLRSLGDVVGSAVIGAPPAGDASASSLSSAGLPGEQDTSRISRAEDAGSGVWATGDLEPCDVVVRDLSQLQAQSQTLDVVALETVERVHYAALCAREQYEAVRERMLVVSASLDNLRHHHEELTLELAKLRRLLAGETAKVAEGTVLLREEAARAEQLRLELFQAYAEQPIREELRLLYAKEEKASDDAGAATGAVVAAHRFEVEKMEQNQQQLQREITTLAEKVRHLTHSAAEKDTALAALQRIITPVQRVLFLSRPSAAASEGPEEVPLPLSGGALSDWTPASSDHYTLLTERITQLLETLQQERRAHQQTSRNLAEAQEAARRYQQGERRSALQQQEEQRRVAELVASNDGLRQQNAALVSSMESMRAWYEGERADAALRHEAERRALLKQVAGAYEAAWASVAEKSGGHGVGSTESLDGSVCRDTLSVPAVSMNTSPQRRPVVRLGAPALRRGGVGASGGLGGAGPVAGGSGGRLVGSPLARAGRPSVAGGRPRERVVRRGSRGSGVPVVGDGGAEPDASRRRLHRR